jgi:hypothetical protein
MKSLFRTNLIFSCSGTALLRASLRFACARLQPCRELPSRHSQRSEESLFSGCTFPSRFEIAEGRIRGK